MPYVAVTLASALFCSEAAAQPKVLDVYEIAHTSHVMDVKFSPDGNQLLSAGGSGEAALKFWEVHTGKNIATMKVWGPLIVLSPDGKLLVKVQGKYAKESATLWDVSSRKMIRSLSTVPEVVDFFPMAFSPDGKTLASWGKPGAMINNPLTARLSIKLWDVATGRNTATLKIVEMGVEGGQFYHPTSVAFSPDGKTLAVGGIGQDIDGAKIKLWDITTGKHIANIIEGGDVNSIAFSPDGKTLASACTGISIFGGTDCIILWDVSTRQNTAELLGHTSKIFCVVFSPDGKMLASCGECDKATEFEKNGEPKRRATVRLWDVETGRNFAKLPGHTEHVRKVAFSPDGKLLASGSDDLSIRLWDVSNAKRPR